MVAITIWLFSFYPLPHSPRIPVIIGTMPNRLVTPLIYKMVERVGHNLLIDYAFLLWLRNSFEYTVKPQKLLEGYSIEDADKSKSYWQTIVPGTQLTAPRHIFYGPTLCHFVRKAYFCSK